jgi:MoxR-like ATPase
MQKKEEIDPTDKNFIKLVDTYQKKLELVKKEISKAVVGQHDVVQAFIEALICNGHCLVEGVPGIAKTLLVRSLAQVCGGQFARIQFTPDLLPTDIVGITVYEEKKGFYTLKGPIFNNFILADEINRAPPKVQSALLESMQEHQATIGKVTYPLPNPFFVMATQNPIENLGTYPLPEAQVDRFIFKIMMSYPEMHEELEIMHQNANLMSFDEFELKKVLSLDEISKIQKTVKDIYLDKKIENYIVKVTDATRNPHKYKISLGKYIEYGGSPRANINMFIASKAHALMKGKTFVTPNDVKEIAKNVLRHRILLNYEGQAEEINTDDIIEEILSKVPIV